MSPSAIEGLGGLPVRLDRGVLLKQTPVPLCTRRNNKRIMRFEFRLGYRPLIIIRTTIAAIPPSAAFAIGLRSLPPIPLIPPAPLAPPAPADISPPASWLSMFR